MRNAFIPCRAISLALSALYAHAAHAACDITAPTSGQTVTCDTRAPNPSAAPVIAASGSVNVTVNVQAGATLDVSRASAITVRDASTVNNLGTLDLIDTNVDGIAARASGAGHDTLINGGSIQALGQDSNGMSNTGAAVTLRNGATGRIAIFGASGAGLLDNRSAGAGTLVNDGVISTGGVFGYAMSALANGDSVVNNGSIVTSGYGGVGLYSEPRASGDAGGNALTNHGSIETSAREGYGIRSLDPSPGAITNTGSILTHGPFADGIVTAGDAKIVNAAGASIVAVNSNGVNLTAGGALTNAGSIQGASGVAVAGAPANIANTGVISGMSSGTSSGASGAGIDASSNLTLGNRGRIEGTAGVSTHDIGPNGAGSVVDIENAGRIAGTQQAGVVALYGGTVDNAQGALIQGIGGIVTTYRVVTIQNRGTIDGTSALGIEALSGANIDNSGTIRGGATAGIFTSVGALKLYNTGTVDGNAGPGIDAGAGADIYNGGRIGGARGVNVAGGALNLNNVGAIDGGVTAQQGATVDNSGRMLGATGLSVFGSMTTVTNTGTIAGASGPGVIARKSASVENSGTIQGATGVSVLGGTAIVTNTGTITGTRYSGIGAVDGLSLDNSGTVRGTAGVSVTAGGASITNKGAILASTGTAVAVTGGAAIDNRKLIRGIAGVSVANGLALIANSGEIDGTRGAALWMQSGGTLNNAASGIVSGGSAGIVTKTDPLLSDGTRINNDGSVRSASGAAIVSQARTSVLNNGLLQGAQGIAHSSGVIDITNNGVIRGTSGAGIGVSGADDSTIFNNGDISGGAGVAIRTGDGVNFLTVNSGTISGQIQQGANYDYVNLFGGQIDSLDGGAGYNSFTIEGGRVLGAITGEDQVSVNGGRVGSIVMHDAPGSYFAMTGGVVDGDVIFSGQNDAGVALGGGVIGGRVDLGDGANSVTVYGASIGRGIAGGGGVDAVLWQSGGIAGPVTLGAGDDLFTMQGQSIASTGALTLIDGGAGSDRLALVNSQTNRLARYTGWEEFDLQNAQITFDANGLTLGDAGAAHRANDGTLMLDQTSTAFAGGIGSTVVQTAAAGQLARVNNFGAIDLTNGGASTADRFVVRGNYSGGATGRLLLQTSLGADDSPSDRLVIAQGTATGATLVGITNVGGIGGLTLDDGILVVQTIDGGKTDAGAFSLLHPVEAGAYRYVLFRGGAGAGTADNWYLRSSVPAAPSATAAFASDTQSVVNAAAPTPIYRPEVPVYAQMPQIARELTVQQIGTFHERQGAQALLSDSGALSASWSRVWGGHDTLHGNGAADQEFSGGIGGVQVGQDIYADAGASGHRNHYGFFVGFARASGDVSGFALATPNSAAGHLSMNAYTAGLYWTHIGPAGWYTDAVVLGSALEADPSTDRGVGASTHGKAFAASLEAGLPIPLPAGLGIEPQVQLIWQHATLSDFDDGISHVSLDEASGLIGRLGVRLFGHFDAAGTTFEPYLRANLWRYFGATDTATFAGTDVIPTSVAATTVQFGAGITAKVSARGSLFANLNYSAGVSGAHRSAIEGGAGVRWAW